MTRPDAPLPLLLLSGTLCDARAFGPVAAGSGHPLVPVDLTAHSSVDEAVDAILASAPRRFIVAGFSLGGIVALALARRAPGRVAAMILAATNCAAVPAANHAARRAAVAGRDPAGIVADLWPAYVCPARRDDAALRELIEDMARACPPRTAERQTELALSRDDSRPHLPRLAMPALVIAGTQDAVTPLDLQRELATGLAAATFVPIDEAGHFVLLEQPARAAAAVAHWLAALPATARFAVAPGEPALTSSPSPSDHPEAL